MMSVNEAIWAIVPAAGTGRRMGSELPKQYLPLMGKTVIEHTLSRLLKIEAITGILVAVHQYDHRFTELPIAKEEKIQLVIGGRERSDSVLSALNNLQKKAKLSDWILVHDAARCCVLTHHINELISALADDAVGGILGVPASDTLKQIRFEEDSTGKIEATLDRQTVWQAQTPQLFRFGLLREALQQSQHLQGVITDEASALEFAGHKPRVVLGHNDNIKITHPEDLAIAEAIMQQQLSAEKDV